MNIRRVGSCFLLVSALVAGMGVVSFQNADAQSADPNLNRARTAFDSGQQLFQAGKFLEAAEQFKRAHAARPFAQFLFNIGACYEKADDFPKALEFYQQYIDANPGTQDSKKTKRRMSVLQKALGGTKADPTKVAEATKAVKALENVDIQGFVVIESEPSGATIYLDSKDNKPLGKTPWNGNLSGEHLIIIDREGYKSTERSIQPSSKTIFALVVILAEEDYLGYLDVTSNVPGAEIFIDDKSVGAKAKTPWSGEIKPGPHKIWISKEGYNEFSDTIEVIAGETHKVSATLEGQEVGYLNVRGKGAEKVSVYVNGDVLCKRGPCLKPLAPGDHKVSIRRDGYKSYNQNIEVQSKTEVTVRAQLAEKPSRTDAIVSYVFAAAFAGGGYYLGGRAQSIKDDVASDIAAGSPPPDSSDPRLGWGLKGGKTFSAASDASYAIGGATLLLAVYYTFREKGKQSTGSSDIRAISLQPLLTPANDGGGYAGLGLSGSF